MYLIDFTHMHPGRKMTGLERVSQNLFSPEALYELVHRYLTAGTSAGLIFEQCVMAPVRLYRDPAAMVLCPGFPPSIPLMAAHAHRIIPYIYDLFLLTRPEELNWRARWYMRPALRYCVRRGRRFLVLSQTVADELRKFCHPDAEIVLYRPEVENVFSLAPHHRRAPEAGQPLRLLSIGTVEPRKDYLAAAKIAELLARDSGRTVELHIVGRKGWGEDYANLLKLPQVILHGYLNDDDMLRLVNSCDMFLYTTKAEGLGLPVLEVQFSGIPIIANDLPVLRETLQDSALFIDAGDTERAARQIGLLADQPHELGRLSQASIANVERWNLRAQADHRAVIDWLKVLSR